MGVANQQPYQIYAPFRANATRGSFHNVFALTPYRLSESHDPVVTKILTGKQLRVRAFFLRLLDERHELP